MIAVISIRMFKRFGQDGGWVAHFEQWWGTVAVSRDEAALAADRDGTISRA